MIKSAIGIGSLLVDGIGDTIRVSLTAPAKEEVRAAWEILSSLNLRHMGPELISCPTCGRCQIDVMGLTKKINRALSRSAKGKEMQKAIKLAVMGCIVNGPGEAKDADIGIAGGKGAGILFKKGKVVKKVKEKDMVRELLKEINV